MYKILFTEKHLLATTTCILYQNENRVNKLRLYVDINNATEFDLLLSQCLVCAILPSGETGKIQFLYPQEELYLDRFIVYEMPVTKAITKFDGIIKLWFEFIYTDGEGLVHALPTNELGIRIAPSNYTDSTIDPDETDDVISELTHKVEQLENTKVGSAVVVDNSIIFYSNTDHTIKLGEVELPKEVVWTIIEDGDEA